jgi:hypothetical protein
MSLHGLGTPNAPSAADVDLTNDSGADHFSLWGLFHRADELVTQHAAEVHVAAADLYVGLADTCEAYLHECLVKRMARPRKLSKS